MENEIRIQVEDLGPVKKKLNITVAAEKVNKEISSAYQSLKNSVNIAGFRKGSVPLNILKTKFGSQVEEDVTKRLIEMTYVSAIRQNSLVPVESPKVEMVSERPEEGKEFSYSVTVETAPQVEITDYKGMELKKESVEVPDSELDEGLERVRQAKAQFKEAERPAQSGDMVVVDFEAFIGEEPIKNGKASDYHVIIGEKTLLPGFDEALSGASKGDIREAKIKFPENYSEGNLGGKESVFKITVKAVKEKSLPDMDDEFAKDLQCESLQALRDKVREELLRVKEINSKEKLKNEILSTLINRYPFEVPDAMVNRYLGVILNKIMEGFKTGDFDPSDRDLNIDQLKEKYKGLAIRSVKEDVILDAISARENIEITPDEVEKAVRHLAESRNVSYDSLMTRIEKEGALEVIKDGLKHEKVFDIIIESINPVAA